MEDEDEVPLSDLFESLPQRTPPLGRHTAHRRLRSTAPAPKRLRSKSCHDIKEKKEHDGKMTSLCRSSRIGDFVWAKAFPNTWWPGQIENFKGPLVLVSFFGCSRTRSFYPSDIRGFEECFPQMVKVIGVKVSEEIGHALNRFARGIALGLKCACGVPSVDKDRSLAVKNGFNPLEIFSFVLDKAVSPQVADEEIATVVRVSASIISFRSTLTICEMSKVDEKFCAKGLLDFVVDMAISPYTDDKKFSGCREAVAQLNALRRFASVKPNLVNQLSWEFMENSLESYNVEAYMGQLYYTLEDEICQKMSTFPEFDFSVEPQEVFELVDVNCGHKENELCVSNMEDIHFFDLDQNYYRGQSIDALHSYTEDEIVKPEVGAEVQHISVFSCTSNATEYCNEIPQIASFGKTASQILANDGGQKAGLLHSFREDASVNSDTGAKIQHISPFSCTNAARSSNEIPQVVLLGETALQIPAKDPGRSADIMHSFRDDASVNPDAGAKVQHISPFSCTNTARSSNKIPQLVPIGKTALQIPAKDRERSADIMHSFTEEASVKPDVSSEVQHIRAFSCNSNSVQCSNEMPRVDPLEKTDLPFLANDRGPSADIMHSWPEGELAKLELGDKVQHMSSFSRTSNVAHCSEEIPQIASLEKTALAKVWGQSEGILHLRKEDASVKTEVGTEVQHISSFSSSSNAAQYSNAIPWTASLGKSASQFLANDQHSCAVDTSVTPEIGAKVPRVPKVVHISSFSCTRDAAQLSNGIPPIAPLEITAPQILAKRKLSESMSGTYKLPHPSSTLSKTVLPFESFMYEDKHAQANSCNNKNVPPLFSCKSNNYGYLSKHLTTSSQHNDYCESRWQAFYAAPLIKDGLQSTDKSKSSDGISCSTPKNNLSMKFPKDRSICSAPRDNLAMKFPKDRNNCGTPKKKLTMKFPRDYVLPSKEDLEKKFRVFGPLDHRKTNVFFYTGVGQVVFLHQADAVMAYNYVTRKAVFGQASMRFWLSKTESTKNSNVPGVVRPSFNVKTCLKKPMMSQLIDDRKNYRVRFSAEG